MKNLCFLIQQNLVFLLEGVGGSDVLKRKYISLVCCRIKRQDSFADYALREAGKYFFLNLLEFDIFIIESLSYESHTENNDHTI